MRRCSRSWRRGAAPAPPGVWFYGVWPGERAGHYLHRPCGGRVWAVAEAFVRRNPRGLYPVDFRDGDVSSHQPEGQLRVWRGDGEMLLTTWDRSADRRGNCCATFLLDRVMAPALALEAARVAFPLVFERIETHLGRAVELAGPVEDQR
jgi:hypothetical protein